MSPAAIVLIGSGWLAVAGMAVLTRRLRRRLELVGDAAHELRGPLATVSLVASSLRREPDGARLARPFEAELERMRAGLADLDAARFGRRAATRPVVVPLERLLRGAADSWRPIAWASGRRLHLSWEAGTAEVLADRGRLSQALGNLVANAVEHGSGTVALHAVQTDDGLVRVEVRDSGPAFRRSRAWRGRRDRGRGLGIVARAIEEAGGRLAVERRADGTTAALELPIFRQRRAAGRPARHLTVVEPAPLAPVIALPLPGR